MAYISMKGNLKEKPTYDTTLYTKPQIPPKATTAPANTYSYYTDSLPPANDKGKSKSSPAHDKVMPKWDKFQRDYASDYMARVRERYMNKPHTYRELVELLRMRVNKEIELQDVWYAVCGLLYESPDLRDEFKTFMGPEHRPL